MKKILEDIRRPEYTLGVRAHDYGKGNMQEILCNIEKDGWHCTQLTLKKLVMGVTSYPFLMIMQEWHSEYRILLQRS